MVKKLNHVAVAVQNIEAARGFYEKGLGIQMSAVEEVPTQKARIAFFRLGDTKIELVEPASPDAPIAKFLETKGPGLHHLCYEVDSVAGELKRLEEQGVPLIDKQPRPGAHGTMIAFVHPKGTGGVLTELCETGERG